MRGNVITISYSVHSEREEGVTHRVRAEDYDVSDAPEFSGPKMR